MGRTPRRDNPYADQARRLGERLRAEREARGLSREQLAVSADLSSATLTKIERHETHDPGFFTVARLAEQLTLDLDDLEASTRGRRRPRAGRGSTP